MQKAALAAHYQHENEMQWGQAFLLLEFQVRGKTDGGRRRWQGRWNPATGAPDAGAWGPSCSRGKIAEQTLQ